MVNDTFFNEYLLVLGYLKYTFLNSILPFIGKLVISPSFSLDNSNFLKNLLLSIKLFYNIRSIKSRLFNGFSALKTTAISFWVCVTEK